MPSRSGVDEASFRRILFRNIALPLGTGVVTAIAFVVLVLYLLSGINWVEHSERVIGNAQEIGRLVSEKESAIRGYLITGDEAFLAPYETAKPKLVADIDTLAGLVSDNAPQVDRLIRIRALQAQWDKVADNLIDARRHAQDSFALVRAGRGSGERAETERELAAFLNIEQTLRLQRVESAKQLTTITVAVFLFLSLTLSAILAIFGRRELMQLSNAFSAAIGEQERQTRALQEQAWLKEGQTQLAEKVIGQQSLAQLCQTILDFLADYLKVSMGAFYVREGDGALKRTASFGFDPDSAPVPDSLAGVKSLVGQAVHARKLTSMHDVPAGYWKVTSALGASVPVSLVIVPIENEGQANGAIELGAMHALTERDQQFLKTIAGNVGDYVEAAQYRERLQRVLEETQQLNEELQMQQEELRTTNEELEQQTTALSQAQAYLANQKAELEQTNDQLAEQARVLDERNVALNAAQGELETRAEALQRASRYKSEFLANMSHELRTPLNSSLILAKLLAENKAGNLTNDQIKYAQTIYSAGNDLLNLINDILDLSKVEAGKLDLHIEEVPLQRIMDTLSRTFEPLARQKRLRLELRNEIDEYPTLTTDFRRLEQILRNLLSNALKFTDAGTVSLTLKRAGGTADRATVQFVVTDTGIGIAPDQLEAIFEAFQQADGTTSRHYGGTGLGLSISRSLAHLLGGDIAVRSAQGTGSTFTLTMPVAYGAGALPVAVEQAPAAIDEPAPAGEPIEVVHVIDDDRTDSAPGRRLVLVVEDEPDFAQVLLDLAHELGYRCIVSGTASEALKLAQDSAPKAILLDIGLPDRSGLVVLQELKANPKTRHIPVHVVSASDRSEAALHLGAIGHAVKPTTREQLTAIFQRLEEKSSQKIKRVLLVEDDARQRQSIVELISDTDVEITPVEFGREALELLKTTIFDCMIIDLKLPDMHGGDLLRQMAGIDAYSFPPVIVYTGRNLTHDEEAELMRYSQSIIIKGARSPERLLDEVTLFLHKVETDLSADRQAMLHVSRARDRVLDGRRVLLVDDDIRNIFSLSSALEHQGLKVDIGRNGFEAIEALDKHPDIDVVLMDVMMPGMDGLEATRHIREDARFRKLPIIAITAKAMKDDQEQCLAAGASDYLAKPIDIDRLYSLLRVWMPRRV
ncbi:multi-sensor hybrid histidine kinase [Caballeronia turbans]|jgi:signal transduction histidine kinase/CheY-like chemotaxis protein/CHASE3 domain sensor protein|uniref:response regulator n=1 Tax=unclassified Caballeronia TaxID=2646786 RepID=UPI00074C59F3|nr:MULTISPECIES: response regulator [unclassified Caballeronia]SAL38298.1 multi-sensor hybrid histidine kinase [Caballeronia turbans]